MRLRLTRPVRCAAILLLTMLPGLAQNASLVGTVRDGQYALVPSASVKLINQLTGVSLATYTGESGAYAFPLVHPGTYALRIERFGFKTYEQRKIALTVDQRARVDILLAIGDTSTFLSVEENAGRVQIETASLGEVIETKNVLELPLNGRYFLDLVRLTPGTTVQSTNNRVANNAAANIGPTGINASGAREDSTNYLFDGINLSDMAQNQISFQPNIDMIQEFKVQIDAFSAEYGRNAGMIVNAVSRSGLNDFHGTGFEFIRNDALDARNYFDRSTSPVRPFKRNIFGYSFGGALIRNKTFFFTSYEGRQGRESSSIRTLVPSAAQRASVTD
ncbi:MAG: carboxypeptidase regulatory-like domain-containing protein, partial [Bryobacteraceae bacterium]